MIKTVLFFPELSSRVKTLLEVGLNWWWLWCLFVFRQSSGLGALEGRHSPVEFFISANKLSLRFHVNIHIFRINLSKNMYYFWQFDIVSQRSLEVEIGFIAPSERVTVPSFIGPDIKISARAVADVMYKLIGASFIIFVRMLAVLCL